MSDYTPLDIGRWSSEDAGERGFEPFGTQIIRGLPFDLCPIHFNKTINQPLEIPIQSHANWIIFAHRLNESHLLEGDVVGHTVAHYCFNLQNGVTVAAPIRERFEIGFVPPHYDLKYYGHHPFLAVPDRFDYLMPRDSGYWTATGFRQVELDSAWPERFFLWAWENQHPVLQVQSLRIEPLGCDFAIGGVTLSSLTEDPLMREPRRPVKIELTDAERADHSFNLSVDVDRGVATYPHPLPREDQESFLNNAFKGWGQEPSDRNSPAYVEIAAAPSATVSLKSGEDEIARVRWGDVVQSGNIQTPAAQLEIVDHGKNWVHVTVLDEETEQPLPCRIHFRSPEGIPYQPYGHHDHLLPGTWHIDVGGDLRLGQITYAYIDGKCQGWLPRGEVLVDVARGFEYEPLRTHIELEPGQRELTLRLKRRMNLNAERWFSGDTHVHFLSTPGAHLEAQGEDLNVVNLLQSQWGHLFTNVEDFIGRPVSSPDGQTIVYANQENRQHMLGHLTLLGLNRSVMPFCSGGPDEAELGGTLETTLSYWADDCHAQGGTVIIPHLPIPNGEPAALIATGRADAIEMLAHVPYFHLEYYRYLNGGYRLPLVGGTDKMTADVPVGLYRTYVHIPSDEEFNYENWCKHLRLGHTFLSGGPILRFMVEGMQLGDTLHLPGNGGTVEVQAEAYSILPIHTLQIVQEGQVVASNTTEDARGSDHLALKAHLTLNHHTWLAARVGGPDYHEVVPHFDGFLHRGIMAHTSPIYVAVGGEWWMSNADTSQYMLTLLHGGLEYIRQRAVYHTHGMVTHHHGQHDHQAYLERPFHEAIEAVHHRSHRV